LNKAGNERRENKVTVVKLSKWSESKLGGSVEGDEEDEKKKRKG
jgi:hypothetical protein